MESLEGPEAWQRDLHKFTTVTSGTESLNPSAGLCTKAGSTLSTSVSWERSGWGAALLEGSGGLVGSSSVGAIARRAGGILGAPDSVASRSGEEMAWLCSALGQPHPECCSVGDDGRVLECVQRRRTMLGLEGVSWEEAEGSGLVWFGEEEAEGTTLSPSAAP